LPAGGGYGGKQVVHSFNIFRAVHTAGCWYYGNVTAGCPGSIYAFKIIEFLLLCSFSYIQLFTTG
jgi:hypothetical protein